MPISLPRLLFLRQQVVEPSSERAGVVGCFPASPCDLVYGGVELGIGHGLGFGNGPGFMMVVAR